MYLLLTDVLACPRCGPEFGLVLLADRIDERRVMEGRLGCPNCREQYPIHDGVLNVRTAGDAPASPSPSPENAVGEGEAAVRLAALLGLADARGTVLLAGPGAMLAGAVADLVPEVEVVAFAAEPPSTGGERPGVSRIAGGGRFPFRSGTLRGVALAGGGDETVLMEGLRVLQPGARLVVEQAAPGTAERLAAMGAQVMLDQEGTVVARAVGEPVRLRVNALR
ncbi:Trm112 family protein [Longimicrobium sp.]|uniref:Trm112 family protein n=1 Tax=Longimicrobium sp. TaxID=2029185 RepID=UPI002C4F31E9|nr:Trm112 family protein [Longimicrobium sp.]HSU13234.1 Trm112 family protein [Longimicrobium sp.]